MKKFSRKLIALLTMFTFFMQIFTPAIISAQEANQSAQINQAVADFQGTYDEIMAIKQIDVGGFADFTLNAINNISSAWQNFTGGATGESDADREARQKKEEAERYTKQIEQANADIKKLQNDAEKTMSLLKSGSLQAAADTDPTKVYQNLDQSTSALGIYQKALTDAGNSLITAADVLSTAALALSAVALLCAGISLVFPPAAPFTGPIATVCRIAAIVVSGAEAVIKTAGNSMIAAANRGITDDAGLVGIITVESGASAVDFGSDLLLEQSGIGAVGKVICGTVVGTMTDSIRATNKGVVTDGSDSLAILGTGLFNNFIDKSIGAIFGSINTKFSEDLADGVLGYSKNSLLAEVDKGLYKDISGFFDKVIGKTSDPLQSGLTEGLKLDEKQPEALSKPGLVFGENGSAGGIGE